MKPVYQGCTLAVSLALASLSGCSTVHDVTQMVMPSKPIEPLTAYVVMGPTGPVARAITHDATCPALVADGQTIAMTVRAAPAVIPLRPTASSPDDSKPSAFPVLTCEQNIPAHTQAANILGQALPLPKAEIKRIVVIGDTGCRLKNADKAYQACNDGEQYPFAQVAAQAAAWQPDLVVHVGDFLYRENKCPEGNAGCQGSPWGYGWDAWQADFFNPAQALLKAAPWAAARGNHESCVRAGQGWWRFMDPTALVAHRDCNAESDDDIGDYSDPYAVQLGGHAQLIMLDTANAPGKPVTADDPRAVHYRDMFHKADALTQNAEFNIGVNHHPILGLTAKIKKKTGELELVPGAAGMQSVFEGLSPVLVPSRINVMLSGHVHLWEQISYKTPHPTQIIAGFSGTQEDTVPLPETLPEGTTPVVGAVVDHFSSWIQGFGFMTMERTNMTQNQWLVKVWDKQGHQVNTCRIDGKDSDCEVAKIK